MLGKSKAGFTPALQSIPNPNQDRLGFPDPSRDTPRRSQPSKIALQREAHRRALADARQLLSSAITLRNTLQSTDPEAPLPGKNSARQVEKLARRLRTELNS